MFSCFPNGRESRHSFNESTEFCHGMIFRYTGFKKSTWTNVFRKYMADWNIFGSREGVYHHFTYFPNEECAIGLRKVEEESPAVISTPDVYYSSICFEPDGTLEDNCKVCRCGKERDLLDDCPGFESPKIPLGKNRLEILQQLNRSESITILNSNPRRDERRLPLARSLFSYYAHILPQLFQSGDHNINCNIFNKLWTDEPERIKEYMEPMRGHQGEPISQRMRGREGGG